MMGLLDYFARYLGYTEIMNNPEDSLERVRLATDILDSIPTMELPASISDEIEPLSGDKNTLALPGNCVSGVNKVLQKYGLSHRLKADYEGPISIFGNKE